MFTTLLDQVKALLSRLITPTVKATIANKAKDRFVSVALDRIRSRLNK
jgi:hypothetical protein